MVEVFKQPQFNPIPVEIQAAVLWAVQNNFFDDATICMAFVIWAVFLTDLMRRRMSRVLGMKLFPEARLH